MTRLADKQTHARKAMTRDQEQARGGDKEQDGDRIESLKMSSGDGGFLVVTDGIVVGPEEYCWSDLHMNIYESAN
ncbi:hypothetical protein D6C89_07008 [Aureobasidium pullulans]|nr:hypothetical protein D6C89_07008 [Aureobasidium pullulans]